MNPPHFFTPINEITFFAAATDMGWIYPCVRCRSMEVEQAGETYS